MQNRSNGPDPVDGLRLALLQQERDRLRTRANGRFFGMQEGLQMFMVMVGVVLLVMGISGATESPPVLVAAGVLLMVQAVYLWFMSRSTARAQLRQLEKRIEAESHRADAPAIAEAAAAARELLLREPR